MKQLSQEAENIIKEIRLAIQDPFFKNDDVCREIQALISIIDGSIGNGRDVAISSMTDKLSIIAQKIMPPVKVKELIDSGPSGIKMLSRTVDHIIAFQKFATSWATIVTEQRVFQGVE